MPDQYDEIGTHPIRYYRNKDGDAEKGDALSPTLEVQIREQSSKHGSSQHIAQATAGLDDRPFTRGQSEVHPFSINGNAADLKRPNGCVGRAVHERRIEHLARRHQSLG